MDALLAGVRDDAQPAASARHGTRRLLSRNTRESVPPATWATVRAPAAISRGVSDHHRPADTKPMRRFTLLLLVVVAAALAAPAVAAASKLIVRNATHITLKVNAKNRAVVSYHANGIFRHVRVWAAISAKPPSATHPDSQVKFRVDYSGGGASPWGGGYWRRVRNACTRWKGSS